MFRFTRKPSSGSHSQYLSKITHSVQCGYMEVVQTMSALWLHSMTCEECVHSTHSSAFFNVVCISWIIKCLILLMHSVTMKFSFSESSSLYVHKVQKYEQEFYRRLWLHLGGCIRYNRKIYIERFSSY